MRITPRRFSLLQPRRTSNFTIELWWRASVTVTIKLRSSELGALPDGLRRDIQRIFARLKGGNFRPENVRIS
jgi:hypothetical protein